MSVSMLMKVLIVEDDYMVAEIIEGFLKKISSLIIIDKVDSISRAKLLLKNRSIDLVLLDLYLTDGVGTDLVKWIRDENIDLDVIMITAEQSLEVVKKSMRHGVLDYLVKPFKFERFKASIENYYNSKNQLDDYGKVNQDKLDALFNVELEQKNQTGLNPTYESIETFLKEKYPKSFTSSEVAKAVGVSRITARRYLESMELEGSVKLEMSYGNVGRPKNKYIYNRIEVK